VDVTHIILRNQELQEQLAKRAKDDARTKTAVVILALKQYLKKS